MSRPCAALLALPMDEINPNTGLLSNRNMTQDSPKVWPNSFAQRGDFEGLAMKKLAAKLFFKGFDCIAQRGLRYPALSRRPREISSFTKCQEIPDLGKLHAVILQSDRDYTNVKPKPLVVTSVPTVD